MYSKLAIIRGDGAFSPRHMKRKVIRAILRTLVPSFRVANPPAKEVVIIVPLSNRAELTEEEKVSMRHLIHYLGNYDKCLIVPEGLEIEYPGFMIKRFDKKFFGSASAHGKLLSLPAFYEKFKDYKYLFFYHLDSLVFSDRLSEWCGKGLDYIGPPWIRCDDSPWVDRPRVGNGGFTLLRVESALKVFANRYKKEPSTYWLDWFVLLAPSPVVQLVEWLQGLFPHSEILGKFLKEWHEMEHPAPHNRNNDIFWSDKAVGYMPEFKVASMEEGLRFAFEVSPRTCLSMNRGEMPFGCHAWTRYDREFWEAFLLPGGDGHAERLSFAGEVGAECPMKNVTAPGKRT